jgi:hypothetical protein
MMEFLNHISTQRGTSYYDGVPKSYLHTERGGYMIEELHHSSLSLSVWRYDLGTPS